MNTNPYIPKMVTITGSIFLTSVSGKVIEIVKIEPRLVPTHKVGNIEVGSETIDID